VYDPLSCITLSTQNETLLKACKEGKEDTVEKSLNLHRPELNVACVGEAGLSPLHYAVQNKLLKSLPMMVQHPTFTLTVTDKVSLACMYVCTYVRMYVCMYSVRICMYVQCTYMYVQCICMYVFTYVQVYRCM